MSRFATSGVLAAALTAGLLAGCSTPAVERDVAGYDHASYVLDLGICNMNDLVANTFEGTATVLATAGAGFVYGAGVSANNHAYHHDHGLEVLLVGGAVGATVGTGVGVYKAFDDITLEADRCMEQQGYVVAAELG